jgi:hypothetical protein
MPRNDGVRTGGGGKVMIQEIVEMPSEAPLKTFGEKQKKVEVLEERLMDLPSDTEPETEPEVDDDEDV